MTDNAFLTRLRSSRAQAEAAGDVDAVQTFDAEIAKHAAPKSAYQTRLESSRKQAEAAGDVEAVKAFDVELSKQPPPSSVTPMADKTAAKIKAYEARIAASPGNEPLRQALTKRIELLKTSPPAETVPLKGVTDTPVGEQATDFGVSGGRGILSGLASGLGGLAVSIPAMGVRSGNYLYNRGKAFLTQQPMEAVETESTIGNLAASTALKAQDQYGATTLPKTLGVEPQPTTEAGQVGATVGNFIGQQLPFSIAGLGAAVARGGARMAAEYAPRAVMDLLKYGVIPGAADEAARRVTEGMPVQPLARTVAAVAATAPSAVRDVRRGAITQAVSDPQFTRAELDAIEDMVSRGIATRPEAAQLITGGRAPGLANTQRLLEGYNQPQVADFMADRARRIEERLAQETGRLSPPPAAPLDVGGTLGAAAQAELRTTPAARGVEAAVSAFPRTSAGEAGTVIQPQVAATRQGLEQTRQATAGPMYTDAFQNTPATTPQPPPIPGSPHAAAAPPVGQISVAPIVAELEQMAVHARPPISTALNQVRENLMRPQQAGVWEHSLEGLQAAREGLDAALEAARAAGGGTIVNRLNRMRAEITQQLESSPLWQQANRQYETLSRPLDPFTRETSGGLPALGAVTERSTVRPSQLVMEPEKVAPTIREGGPTAAAELNQIAPPGTPAHAAHQNFIFTEAINGAGGAGRRGFLDLDAGALRKLLVDRVDELNQFPAVRAGIMRAIGAKEGLERLVTNHPLSNLLKAGDRTTKEALTTIFGVSGDAAAKEAAIAAVRARSPQAAREIGRLYLEQQFAAAGQKGGRTPSNRSVQGATFAHMIAGPEFRADFEAVMRGIYGPDAARGLNRFLDELRATGERMPINSKTSFNQQMDAVLQGRGILSEGAKLATGPFAYTRNWLERIGGQKNQAMLGRLFTDPAAGAQFRNLANARTEPEKTKAIYRIGQILSRAYEPDEDSP